MKIECIKLSTNSNINFVQGSLYVKEFGLWYLLLDDGYEFKSKFLDDIIKDLDKFGYYNIRCLEN